MSVGFFAVDRGIFDHESFEPEPFTQREAWLWLIAEAAWRSCRVRVGRHRIELRRGQCVHSVRFMAVAWQWHRSKVERFLTHLKTEMMIETHTETGITVITVYNYDKFQRVAPPSETVADTQSETAARQRRDREEELRTIKQEGKKDVRAVAIAARPSVDETFDRFWKVYPRRDGANPRAPAAKKFAAKVKSGADPEAIIASAERYAEECRRLRKVGTPYVARALTWLNENRWQDYPPTAEATAPPGFYAAPDSPELEAWDRHFLATKGKKLRDRNGGWHVATRWPPGHHQRGDGEPRAIIQ